MLILAFSLKHSGAKNKAQRNSTIVDVLGLVVVCILEHSESLFVDHCRCDFRFTVSYEVISVSLKIVFVFIRLILLQT